MLNQNRMMYAKIIELWYISICGVFSRLLITGILKTGPFLLMVLSSWRREERDGKTRGLAGE